MTKLLLKKESNFPTKVTQSFENAHLSDELEHRFPDNAFVDEPICQAIHLWKPSSSGTKAFITEESPTSFPGFLTFVMTRQTYFVSFVCFIQVIIMF